MNITEEVCSGKDNCTSSVAFACNCGSPIVFLCPCCVSNHLTQPHPHLFLRLDQARQLLTSSDFSANYVDIYAKHLKIKLEMQSYISNLSNFKQRVTSLHHEILKEIETTFSSNLARLDGLLETANKKMIELQKRTENLDKIDTEFLQNYETRGIEGFVENFAENLSLDESEIKLAIHRVVRIETNRDILVRNERETKGYPIRRNELKQISYMKYEEINHKLTEKVLELKKELLDVSSQLTSSSSVQSDEFCNPNPSTQTQYKPQTHSKSHRKRVESQSSCIFVAKKNTKELVKYDSYSNSITSYDLSDVIYQNFVHSASCILPNGHVLIAGGQNPYHGDTYQIDVSTSPPVCIQLDSLNFPRSYSRLICYKDSVYNFGGFNKTTSNKAEVMKLSEKSWKVLPDMKEPRRYFGDFAKNDKIYLIGGYCNTSIEYFDVRMNLFCMVEYVKVPSEGVVCGIIDERLHVVNKYHLRVYDTKFREVDGKDNICSGFYNFCFSNVVVRDGKILFVRSSDSSVHEFDAKGKSLKRIKSF
jgi:hypothetical protein